MRGRKYLGIISAICLALLSAGCGEKFPEMTEEEYNHTVEYAAGLLMRYSNNGQERLIYVDAKEVEKQRKKDAEKAEKTAETQETQKPKPAPAQPKPEPEPEPEPVMDENPGEGTDQQDPASVTEAAEGTETTQEAETTEAVSDPNAITLSSEDSNEIMEDIFLSYQGYAISSTYPESSKSYVVNADKGKKLLVLRFDLYNGSNSQKQVNMIPLNLMFQILLNGKNLGYSSVTFLPNDLASYVGNIDSRAHESVVVLTQISESEATNIQSLGMIASIRGETKTVNLK
jgi:hypothetical protein